MDNLIRNMLEHIEKKLLKKLRKSKKVKKI